MYKYNTTAEKEFKRVASFIRKPKGIILFDSYNNEWFPTKIVTFDTTEFNLRKVKDDFHRQYGGSSASELFMPYHYFVEFIGKDYFPIQTRPIMYKSLIPGYEEYISVCIAGNSEEDIYPHQLYKMIAHLVLNSLHYIPGWKLNPESTIEYHNLGKQFKISQLEKHFR
jgi:hypothetical protein